LLLAKAVNCVWLPLADKDWSVGPHLPTEPAFLTLNKLTLIATSILPSFEAISMLQIIQPSTIISAPSSNANVWAHPTGLIAVPLPLVDIPNYMSEFSMAMRSIQVPLTFIAATIRPTHGPLSFSDASPPFSKIDCSTWLISILPELKRLLWINPLGTYCFPILTEREVFPSCAIRLSIYILSPGSVCPVPRLNFDNSIDCFHIIRLVAVINGGAHLGLTSEKWVGNYGRSHSFFLHFLELKLYSYFLANGLLALLQRFCWLSFFCIESLRFSLLKYRISLQF
jgi:hypothetical protein